MIKHIGFHSPEPADIIDDFLMMRQQFAELHLGFPILGKLAIRSEDLGILAEKGKTLPGDERFGRKLLVILLQHWFLLEEIEMAGTSRHKRPFWL